MIQQIGKDEYICQRCGVVYKTTILPIFCRCELKKPIKDRSYYWGTGYVLYRIIRRLFKQQVGACGCQEYIEKMNAWGPVACLKEHLREIVDHLLAEAKKRMPIRGNVPLIPRWVAERMVFAACRIAEKHEKREASPPLQTPSQPVNGTGLVDLVYVLGKGTIWRDVELRYALRSLERYALDLGRVFVVGEKPSWLQNVVHVPCPDVKINKDANMIRKVRSAIKAGCSKRFVRSSDDQGFLSPVRLAELPAYAGGDLTRKTDWPEEGWWKRVEATRDYLVARGFPARNFDTHVPQPYSADVFEAAVNAAPYAEGVGLCINTLAINQDPTVAVRTGGNFKAGFHSPTSLKQVRKICSDPKRIYYGFNDDGFLSGVREYLAERFPTPSRFEVDSIAGDRPVRRGIVTLAGGPLYSLNAYIGCRMLRALGCTLPIEWCYLGEEMSLAWMDVIQRTIPDVRLVDLGGGKRDNAKRRGGWQAKVNSILKSEFDELLFLDADNHVMRDPTYLFDHPLFKQNSCVLWPDINDWNSSQQKLIHERHGVLVSGRQAESGQMLFRPAECLGLLKKAQAINRASKEAYKYLHGDKDTFVIGGLQAGDRFVLNSHVPVRGKGCRLLVQHDLDGRALFSHLTGGKWQPGKPSTAWGRAYPNREMAMEFYRDLKRADVLSDWKPLMKEPAMRVRDTFCASEAMRIINDDQYKIRPMIGHRIPVRYVVDIGGNAGAFTVAASIAYPGCTIICIEPDPELMEDIRHNTRDCKAKIHYVEAACVGNDAKMVEFVRVVDFRAGSYVQGRKAAEKNADPNSDQTINVPAVRLPDLLEQFGFESIDILKIDAEGVEGEILSDLRQSGWMPKTHWLRGEWHGRESWPVIHAALDESHVVALEANPDNGELIAHNRKDS